MLKGHKKVLLIVCIVFMVSLFTACDQAEKAWVDAFVKSQEIEALESTGSVDINVEASGLDDMSQMAFDDIKAQINNASLSFKQKASFNQEQSKGQAYMEGRLQAMDMDMQGQVWLDMDLTAKDLVFKEIIALPALLMDQIPGGQGKDYILLDLEEMSELSKDIDGQPLQTPDLEETMQVALDYQEKFQAALLNYLEDFHFAPSPLTRLESKTVEGKSIDYYQLRFDNESFKDFLEYTIFSLLEDQEILPLFEDYMSELMALSGEEMPDEFSLEDSMPQTLEDLQAFFEAIEGLTLLGENGMVITYGINEEGYFVSEEGSMDFLIDSQEWASLFEESAIELGLADDAAMPVFELSIRYDSQINSINQEIDINMPEMTEENTLNYMALLESLVADTAAQQELVVIIGEELVEFDQQPLEKDAYYLLPFRELADHLGASIDWREEGRQIELAKKGQKLTFTDASRTFTSGSQTKELDYPVLVEKGVSYIHPQAFLAELGYESEWNEEFKLLIIVEEGQQ